jgi:hypothetical protein
MEISMKTCRTVLILFILTFTAASASAQIQLKPGVTPDTQVHLPKARNYAFCEIVPIMGAKPGVVAQFYNTSGASDCPPAKFDKIDPKKLAAQVGADEVWLNPRRHWMMDQLWIYKAGETVDFDGVKATWVATMTPEQLRAGSAKAFTPVEIRRESQWLFKKGKPVYLMRTADGKVYVMQSYVSVVDKSLNEKNLAQLGSKLKLPEGWRFEVKTLTKDLSIDPRRSGGVAHIIQDELKNTYEGCGFDATCNYVP